MKQKNMPPDEGKPFSMHHVVASHAKLIRIISGPFFWHILLSWISQIQRSKLLKAGCKLLIWTTKENGLELRSLPRDVRASQ